MASSETLQDSVSRFMEELPPEKTARIAQEFLGEWREWTGIVESPDGEKIGIDLLRLDSLIDNKEVTGCLSVSSNGKTETTILREGKVIYRHPGENGHSSQLVPQLNFFGAMDG